MSESTIQEAVLEDDDAVEAALAAKFAGADEAPQENAAVEGAEAPEADEATEETSAETEEATETEAPDEAFVKVKEGDKEHLVKVSDLKRLYGQEASLTRKSQELAEATTRASGETEKAVAIMGALIQKADKHWETMGYDKVDLALAAQRLDERAYRQLKSDMEEAHNQRVFLRQEGNALLSQVRENREAAHREALKTVDARVAEKVSGWTAESRKEVVAYAKTQGFPDHMAEGISDPAAIMMIRKAMLFDRGQKAVSEKVKPAAASSPSKTIKPGSTTNTTPDKAKEALRRLKRSGSDDDATAAFLARFGG